MITFTLDDAWLKGSLHVGLIGKRSAILWAVLEAVNLSSAWGRRVRTIKEIISVYIKDYGGYLLGSTWSVGKRTKVLFAIAL